MNKERLRKLAQRLDKTAPEKFDMTNWCGTACCIGGHALIMARKFRPAKEKAFGTKTWWDYGLPTAAVYLGLNDNDAELLLDWGAHNNFAEPKQAAKVIRHLIKTGKVEWERFVNV